MTDWSPAQYLRFVDERTRPARDLLAHVPRRGQRLIYDLGCGPGNSTALLVEAFPGATVIGIDSSAAMLREAGETCPAATYQQADLASWKPEANADLLFSNATFQWVPDHVEVIEKLAVGLKAQGVLAVQMPDNLMEPSHRLMREVAEEGPWAGKLADASGARDGLPTPQEYYRRLKPYFTRLDIWHTIYNHPLPGVAGIADWFKSTGLRPYLNPLDGEEQSAFLAAYRSLLAAAYPAGPDGSVLLRFPRLFLVGER